MRSIWSGLIVCLALLLTGCNDDTPDDKASGKTLFTHYCAGCHGENGSGKFLKGIPANTATRLSRQEVVNLLLYGSRDLPAMPTFRDQLTPHQARKVADHLLFTLKNE